MKNHYFINKAKTLNKIFVSAFSFIFIALNISTAQAAIEQTVESGQYFWQISRPGLNPSFSYILGSNHYMCLDNNSLPVEIKRALKSSKVGILEANTETTIKEQNTLQSIKGAFNLPEGLSLLDYLSEEKVQEIFDFFHSFVMTYDTEERDLENLFKTTGVDVRNYEQFNRSQPLILVSYLASVSVLHDQIINSSKSHKSEENNQTSDEIIQNFIDRYKLLVPQNSEEVLLDRLKSFGEREISSDIIMLLTKDPKVCLSPNPMGMDFFIEKSLFCDKRSIYPLETAKIVVSTALLAGQDLQEQANSLYGLFDDIKNKEKIKFRFFSEFPTEYFKYLKWPFEKFKEVVIEKYTTMYSQGEKAFHDSISSSEVSLAEDNSESIIDSLKERGCTISPEIDSLINTYIDTLQEKVDFALKVGSSGKSIDEEILEIYFDFNAELRKQEQNIFSACFLNYRYADKELEDNREEKVLQRLKLMAILTTSRDQKMAQSILDLLDKINGGGVFAVMGYAHLSGVIRHLRDAGYLVNPVSVSSPIVEAEGCVNALGYDNGQGEMENEEPVRLILPPL